MAIHSWPRSGDWVWVTGSETRFAPAFNDFPLRSTPYTLVGATSSPRYHLARRDYGHYAALRARLTTYAVALAGRIDRAV